jgi:hypothetical protein
MRPKATSVAVLSHAVAPTARTIRWAPSLLLSVLLAVVGALTAASSRPAGPFLVVAAAALAGAAVASLHDPARSLLEAMPVTAMQRRLLRLAAVGVPALVLWTWLVTILDSDTSPGVGPLVALTAAGTAAVVWGPRDRSLAIGVGLPVGWYVLALVAPASGPVATLAGAWWDHPWRVAGVAVALCVLGRSR